MIELVATTASFLLGFAVARRRRPPAIETMFALRHAAPTHAPYRDARHDVACTLDELRAGLVAAGLGHELAGAELRVRRVRESLRIVVNEPRRVTLASLDGFQTGCETLGYELALALVPIFGPMTFVDAMFGALTIDASRTVDALVAERAERIKAIARGIAEDMAHKAAVYSKIGVRP